MKRIYLKPEIKAVRMYPHIFLNTSPDSITNTDLKPTGESDGSDDESPSRYFWNDLMSDE